MVVAGHHVLRSQISERDQMNAKDLLDVAFVTFGDCVGECIRRGQQRAASQTDSKPDQFYQGTTLRPQAVKVIEAAILIDQPPLPPMLRAGAA